jgi:hypothetical protein
VYTEIQGKVVKDFKKKVCALSGERMYWLRCFEFRDLQLFENPRN